MNDTDKIKIKLIKRLKTISDDEDFIIGVISNAKHDDDRKSLIEYIDKGEKVTYEQLLMLSLWLGQERNKINK